MKKIIIGINNNVVSIQDVEQEKINNNLSFLNPSEIYKKELESLKIEDEYWIKVEDNLIKLTNLNQLEHATKFVDRLFCFIDSKNNIRIPLGTATQTLGNLELKDENVLITEKILYDDFKFLPYKVPSESISRVETIDDGGDAFLKSFFKFNDKKNFENTFFGYIDVGADFIFTIDDKEIYPYQNTIGKVITERLYNSPVDIKILAWIEQGEIHPHTTNVSQIIGTNNIFISKNGE